MQYTLHAAINLPGAWLEKPNKTVLNRAALWHDIRSVILQYPTATSFVFTVTQAKGE